MKIARAAALAIVVMFGAGCATIGSLQPGTGTGSTIEIEGRSYEEIWRAAVRTAGRSLTIVESDKPQGTIKAEKGAGIRTWEKWSGSSSDHPPTGQPSTPWRCKASSGRGCRSRARTGRQR